MSVDYAGGDRSPRLKSEKLCRLLRQSSAVSTGGNHLASQLVLRRTGKALRKLREEIPAGISVLTAPQRLVARHARASFQASAELHDKPVARLDKNIRIVVHPARLGICLKHLGKRPLAGGLSAVALQPCLSPRFRKIVYHVRILLRPVMLPQLDVCVRLITPLFRHAERRSVCIDRHYSAGSEIHADAYNIAPVHPALRKKLRNGVCKRVKIILRILKRRFRLELSPGGYLPVHDSVRITEFAVPDLFSVGHAHKHRPSGQRSEIKPDRILF